MYNVYIGNIHICKQTLKLKKTKIKITGLFKNETKLQIK